MSDVHEAMLFVVPMVWVSAKEFQPSEYGRYLVMYRQHGQWRPFIADWDYPEDGGRWSNTLDAEITHWAGPIVPPAPED